MTLHAHILDLREMGKVNPIPNPFSWWISSRILTFLQNTWGGVKVELENYPELIEPVIFTMNHSHYFDWTQARLAIFNQKGLKTTTFVKVRAFQNRLQGRYMKTVGNIPIASRGYLISADFAHLHGRKLEAAEYRCLRTHIDQGVTLPDEPLYRSLVETPRDMLGLAFDPDHMTYREAVGACYSRAMATTLSHASTVIRDGKSLHIYPEGLFSSRLSKGRIGAIQIAAALDIPVVPTGLSGMNELFGDRQIRPHQGGTLTMRFGEPYRVKRAELEGFKAFEPSEEDRLRDVLEDETQLLMQKINALLDPEYTWGENLDGDGLQGVARFFD